MMKDDHIDPLVGKNTSGCSAYFGHIASDTKTPADRIDHDPPHAVDPSAMIP